MGEKLNWSNIEILETIGSGHAGEVKRGRLLKRYGNYEEGFELAVKFYRAWVIEEPGQYERIMRELLIGRTLKCKNIIHPLCIVNTSNNLPALVMPLIKGETVESILKKSIGNKDPLPITKIITIFKGLAYALFSLHSKSVIHRDVKPANIMITPSGEPILLDLGVISVPNLASQTTTKTFLGTIRYAAYEYLFEEKCLPVSDVFSLGITILELINNRVFFQDIQNWANLISERSSAQNPYQKEYQINSKRLQQFAMDASIGLAETIELLIGRMLLPINSVFNRKNFQERIGSEELWKLLQSEFWNQPFYINWRNINKSTKMIIYKEPEGINIDPWIENHKIFPILQSEFIYQPKGKFLNELFQTLPTEVKQIRNIIKGYFDQYYFSDWLNNKYLPEYEKMIKILEILGLAKRSSNIITFRLSLLLLYRYGYL